MTEPEVSSSCGMFTQRPERSGTSRSRSDTRSVGLPFGRSPTGSRRGPAVPRDRRREDRAHLYGEPRVSRGEFVLGTRPRRQRAKPDRRSSQSPSDPHLADLHVDLHGIGGRRGSPRTGDRSHQRGAQTLRFLGPPFALIPPTLSPTRLEVANPSALPTRSTRGRSVSRLAPTSGDDRLKYCSNGQLLISDR